MKRTLLRLLVVGMIVTGCTDNATNEAAKDNPNKKISADFLEQQSFINIQHIDSTTTQNKTVNLVFNKSDLNSMQQTTMIAITPEIVTGADKIKISPTILNVSVKDLIDGKSDFQLTTVGVVNGGAVDIKFVVNQIPQTNHLKFMLSHREIVSLIPDSKLYKIGTPGKVLLTVKSNVSNDNFTVSFTGRNIDKNSLTPSCSLNDFSTGFATCEDISFTATDTNAKITATIEDELREPYSQPLNICPDRSDTLYFESIKLANIGFKQDLTLNVSRCSNNLSPLSATINFSLDSSLRLVHRKALKNPIPINEIIGVQNSEDNSFNFKLNESTTTVVISRKPNTATQDNFRYDLPVQFIIQASALNYASTQKLEVNNVDNEKDPKITLLGDMEIEQGSTKTVQFTRENIETTKINFCLAKTETSNICDVDQSGYSLTEITPENLQLDLTGKKLAAGQYYILARLDNDAKLPVAIAGHSRVVNITAVETLNFVMLPAVKHVLIKFPSYYYLGVSDNATPSTVTGDKLHLYSLDSNPSYCSKITAKPVDNNNPNTVIADCTISSQTVNGSCTCPLSNGKLNKICVFKLTMPNNFVDGESCKFSVRTDKNFNEGYTLATGTNGHPEIKIQTNSEFFKSAILMDMYSDGNGTKLNDANWISTISSANITNNSIFDDALLFEIAPSYFGTENNNFVIRNYPGKNAIEHMVSIPQTAFILGYDDKIWNSNRCSGYDEDYPSALGCSSGGWPSYRGSVAIPGGAIKVDNNEVASASGNIMISSDAWRDRDGAGMPKLTDYSISKFNNNTIQMNLRVT